LLVSIWAKWAFHVANARVHAVLTGAKDSREVCTPWIRNKNSPVSSL
jgi:hypothetical protein